MMIEVKITDEHRNFASKYAEKQNIGGYSNLSKNDLMKASRLDFQFTGVFGEIAWFFFFRDGMIERLSGILDYKFDVCRKNNVGDGGFDDSITHNNKTRYVDIKATHIDDEKRIKYLNLIIPPRELHDKMIYVCAFSVGETRREVSKVVLAGWAITEDIHKKWKYDNTKYCVPVSELRDMDELNIYINHE